MIDEILKTILYGVQCGIDTNNNNNSKMYMDLFFRFLSPSQELLIYKNVLTLMIDSNFQPHGSVSLGQEDTILKRVWWLMKSINKEVFTLVQTRDSNVLCTWKELQIYYSFHLFTKRTKQMNTGLGKTSKSGNSSLWMKWWYNKWWINEINKWWYNK